MPETTKAKSKIDCEVMIINDIVFNFESKSGEELIRHCINRICKSRLTTAFYDKVVKHAEHSYEADKLIAENYIYNTKLKTHVKKLFAVFFKNNNSNNKEI
ncbi:hypothetical protein CDIK_3897 [Cucumispora dikerogammari]|nr:hypothetical protein CDIK_3897 [Cucumispora dikerogammari]